MTGFPRRAPPAATGLSLGNAPDAPLRHGTGVGFPASGEQGLDQSRLLVGAASGKQVAVQDDAEYLAFAVHHDHAPQRRVDELFDDLRQGFVRAGGGHVGEHHVPGQLEEVGREPGQGGGRRGQVGSRAQDIGTAEDADELVGFGHHGQTLEFFLDHATKNDGGPGTVAVVLLFHNQAGDIVSGERPDIRCGKGATPYWHVYRQLFRNWQMQRDPSRWPGLQRRVVHAPCIRALMLA